MNKRFDFIKIFILSLVLATLIYPGFEKLYLYKQTVNLEDLVMAPLGFLGENKTILSNDDKFTRYGTKYKSLDLLRGRDLFIGIKSEFKFHEKWANLEEERSRVFLERWKQLDNIYRQLKNGEYSLIVYGPLESTLDIFWLMQFNQIYRERILDKENYENLDDYCELFLLSTAHGCNECQDQIRIFLKENKSCEKIIPKIGDYYSKNFYKICKLDEITANVGLRTMLLGDNLLVNANCKEGGRLLMRYNDKTFRFIDFLSILSLSILILIFNKYSLKNKKGLSLALLVLTILIFLSLINSNYKYFINYGVNETEYADPNIYQFYNSFSAEDYFPSSKKPINISRADMYNLQFEFPRYTTSKITIREDLKEPGHYTADL